MKKPFIMLVLNVVCLIVFITSNAFADNSNFYGTYAMQISVEGCGSGNLTVVMDDDSESHYEGHTYMPSTGNYISYSYIEGNKTYFVTISMLSNTSWTMEQNQYIDGTLDWSQTLTVTFSNDYNTFTFSGTMWDSDPSECSGTLTGSGVRTEDYYHTVYLPHITGGAGDWNELLQADNLSSETVTFTLILFGSAGETLHSADYSVNAYDKLEIYPKTINGNAMSGKITYTESKLSFRTTQENLNGGGIAEFHLSGNLNSSLYFFFTEDISSIEWKGLALTNFSDSATDVTLMALGNGTPYWSTTVNVGPNQKIIGTYETWFPMLNLSQVQVVFANSTSASLSGVAISGDLTNSVLLFTPGKTLE